MISTHSIQFFDQQFRQQAKSGELSLNPFETTALNYLHGRVLDFGCGMGNLSFAAAQRGCSVLALDGSPAAIQHIRQRAKNEHLPVHAELADLRDYPLEDQFDAVVSIGLLMFFDCPTAFSTLEKLKRHVRQGGIVAINVLVEGTTYLDMFDTESHCLFSRQELETRLAAWTILHSEYSDFAAPGGRNKAFATVIARKQ